MIRGRLIAFSTALFAAGCLIPQVNFDPPSYRSTSLDATPNVVLANFIRKHPEGQIDRIESRKWIDDVWHYRIFFRSGGGVHEIAFREDGSLLALPDFGPSD